MPRVAAKLALGRLRSMLDESLFPDAPPPPRLTLRRTVVFGGLALAGIAIQLARLWSSKPLDTLWAEDGHIWLADATRRSLPDSLTTPYFGYIQLLPRIIAEPVSKLSVHGYAPAMAVAGAALVTLSAFVVWRASSGHIESAFLRGALALMVVLLPIVGVEGLDNVTITPWYLLFASFWLLLWRPTRLASAVGAGCLLFLCALSTVGVLVLLPLWLLRLITVRSRNDTIILTGLAVGLAFQLALSWNSRDLIGEEGAAPLFIAAPHSNAIFQIVPGVHISDTPFTPHWDWSMLPAYAQRVVGGAVTGQVITGDLWELLGTPFEILLAIGLVAFVIFAIARNDPRTRVFIPLAVGTSLALFLLSGVSRGYGSAFLWPHGSSNSHLSHWMIVPTLLLLSALVVQLDIRPNSVPAITWGRLRAGVVLFVLVSALVSFDVSDPSVRGSPTWSSALDAGRSECSRTDATAVQVPINPALLGFRMPLACSELR